MSFGGLFGGGGGGGSGSSNGSGSARIGMNDLPHRTSAVVSQPLLDSSSIYKPVFPSPSPSPGLSLALQANTEGQGGDRSNRTSVARNAGGGEVESSLRMNKEDEYESRSGGSDNLGGVSGDDLDLDQENPRKKKRYHRHTSQQIQELEAFFKECPHPDEKQRSDLSKRLALETRQVKFWFQNRRTQMKTQMERHENTTLRQENDKLRAENLSIKEVMRNPICTNCGGLAVLGEVSLEEQHLRVENARLKDELNRVCSLVGKFIGKPLSSSLTLLALPMPSSTLELAVGSNAFPGLGSVAFTTLPDSTAGLSSPLGSVITPARNVVVGGADRSHERLVYLELALTAMDELVKMAQMEEPLWIPGLDGGRETLNFDEYHQNFPRCVGTKPIGFASEATRSTCVVFLNSLALVETLMDANRWADMFPSVIAKATTTDVISAGMGGSRTGALQLVLSPLVPVRDCHFLRFCKQLANGAWAVVDVSVDGVRDGYPSDSTGCRRLPSGCVLQDMPNGYSKVTWVEHAEYDEAAVHPLYRPWLRSGMALGAARWVAALQRQCQSLAILMSSLPADAANTLTPSGRRSMVKLAQRMTDNFCAGVCSSSAHEWNKLRRGVHIGKDVRVMTRQSLADPGEPPGVVLSAATSVWLPATPQQVFDFLRNEQLRSQWDILSNGGPMQEMAHIAKGPDSGNAVSLLRASAMSADQSSMLILQETCTDASGSLVVYAPVDVPAMHLVMSGGDSSYVALLPSGFAIVPDGNVGKAVGGSLLTVAFQILVNSLQPTAKLTVESVETVNNLISCTVQKIKAALNCDA